MSDLIRREAAISALEDRRNQYLPDSPTWLQIQIDIHTIHALPAVQPDAAAIKSAAFEIAVLMELHAATCSTTKAKAEGIERGIRALINSPGKEVPNEQVTDTAPAGLSAGGGEDWQPIATAPKDRSSFIGYWRRHGLCGCEVRTWWCDIDERWESPFETASSDSEPTHWMPPPAPPATDGGARMTSSQR